MRMELLFLILLILAGVLSFLILKPFINYIIFAIILVFLTYPLYKKILGKLRNKSLSALILIVIMILIVIIPSFYISTTLFLETRNVLQGLGEVEFENLGKMEDDIHSMTGMELNIIEDIKKITTNLSGAAISFIMENMPKLTKIVVNLFIGLTIMFFSMFYFYVDGERISNRMRELIPIEKKYRKHFFEQAYKITQGLFLGIFFVALVQGSIAGIGYLIFGVPNPIFWGVVTILVAMIPVLGTPWVYVPISLYMMFNGNLFAGIGLLLYGIIIVSQIDNIIRPRFVRMASGVAIHPLIIILGVIGGILLFGLVGVIIGPLVLAFFIELLEIYRKRKH